MKFYKLSNVFIYLNDSTNRNGQSGKWVGERNAAVRGAVSGRWIEIFEVLKFSNFLGIYRNFQLFKIFKN